MNAALHIKTLIWFGNCQPQKERNKGKSACNNRGSGKAAASSQRVLSTTSGKSHVRNAILQLSSFQTGGNSLERWVLLQQPKTWVLQLGRVHLKSSGLYLPPQGALHMGLSRDLPALPGLMLTALLPCSGWSFKTAYREIPSAKLHIKLFLSPVNNQRKAVEIHAAK